MAPVITDYAGWILFAWILANQGGVPVPVVPALLGAGALAGSGRLSIAVILAVAVGATLCADLGWYSLGRWRGARALEVLGNVFPRAATYVRSAEHFFLGRPRTFQLVARFVPELNPIAAGLAGLTRLSLARFVGYGAVSAYATDRYRYGFASYFEVLEAQQQLYPAQNTLAQIRRDRLLAHVRLYKALGGGWSLTDAEWKDQARGSGG